MNANKKNYFLFREIHMYYFCQFEDFFKNQADYQKIRETAFFFNIYMK